MVLVGVDISNLLLRLLQEFCYYKISVITRVLLLQDFWHCMAVAR